MTMHCLCYLILFEGNCDELSYFQRESVGIRQFDRKNDSMHKSGKYNNKKINLKHNNCFQV